MNNDNDATIAFETSFKKENGDGNRSMIINLFATDKSSSEKPIEIGEERYQSLVGSLRYAISRLEIEIAELKRKPGGQSIFRDRVEKLERQLEETIYTLCIFDY